MIGSSRAALPRRQFLKGLGLSAAVKAGWEPWQARAAAEARIGQLTLSLFHTTDLHGHILPTQSYEGLSNVGGLARCASQIQTWRREQPHSLLIDLGDVYQGTPESRSNNGQLMVQLLNKLQYDAWVLGNHEFDWGADTVAKSIAASAMPVLASNAQIGGRWTHQLDPSHPFSKVAPYLIKEVAGFKIGIIGSLTPGLPAWLHPDLLADFSAADPLASVQYAIQKLQAEKVDAIILACHFGLKAMYGLKPAPDDFANRVNEITRSCPELHLVIGAHTHKDFSQCLVNGIPYSQASYYGMHLGRVDLTFDLDSRQLVGRGLSTKLMVGTVPEDPLILAAAAPDLASAHHLMARTIGTFTAPLPCLSRPGCAPPSLLLITRSIRQALANRGHPIDGVIHGLFLEDRDLPAGPVTLGQSWEIIPYENRLATVLITGAELFPVMEELYSAKYSTHQLDGFHVTTQGLKSNLKVTAIATPDGTPIDPAKLYRIALNAYDAQSAGHRFDRLHDTCLQPRAQLQLHATESRDALVEFISARRQLGPQDLLPT